MAKYCIPGKLWTVFRSVSSNLNVVVDLNVNLVCRKWKSSSRSRLAEKEINRVTTAYSINIVQLYNSGNSLAAFHSFMEEI